MILVNRNSPLFDEALARKGFEKNAKLLDDIYGFDDKLSDTMWNGYDDKGYFCTIFTYFDGEKHLLGGYAERKRLKSVLQAIKTVAKNYKKLYAETRHRNAKFVLLRTGFKFKNNIWEFNNEQWR